MADHDALRTEWAAFFGLLSNDRGIRLRVNLPDTLVLQRGRPHAWLATNTEGYVVQRCAAFSSMEDVRQHLLNCSQASHASSSGHVAIARLPDGTPKLLTRQALDALCDRLAAQQAPGSSAGTTDLPQLPSALQAWVRPLQNLRYVTSYNNTGTTSSCHTFQRLYSRRYLPYRDLDLQQLQPDTLAATQPLLRQTTPSVFPPNPPAQASASPAGNATAAQPAHLGSGAAATSAAGMHGGGGCAAAGKAEEQWDDGQAGLEGSGLAGNDECCLDSGSLAPVDPSLRMLTCKAAHGLVQHVQRAHLLTLRGLVCEFVRGAAGGLWFLGPIRCDWVSLTPGRGGEPWANTNLTQQPEEEQEQEAEQEDCWAAAGDGHAGNQLHVWAQRQACTPPDLRQAADSSCRGSRAQQESGSPSPAAGLAHRPHSPSQQQHHYQQYQQYLQPAVPASQAGSLGARKIAAQQPCSRRSDLAGTPCLLPHYRQGEARLGEVATTAASTSSAWRQHANSTWLGSSSGGRGVRWSAGALASRLTREVEALREEVLVKSDMADELAGKVEALQHDKHVVTSAFERVLGGLQSDLLEVKQRLEDLRFERDQVAARLSSTEQALAATEAKLAGTEQERRQLRATLDAERGSVLATLSRQQQQQEHAGLRAEHAEAELHVLQERLQEEQAGCDALKKQIVAYQQAQQTSNSVCGRCGAEADRAMCENGPEDEYADTLQAVDELLMRESDPSGERYSLSKVLHTCQADLHAVFNYYCLVDTAFARHWPPKLTLVGWLALLKDVGATVLVPGTRTRADNTLHVQEATDVFRRYCVLQPALKGAVPAQALLHRDSLLDGPLPAATGDQPPRPPSAQSTAGGRPGSAAIAQLAAAAMEYQGFCAALVHVAAKLARGSIEAQDTCPFLSEQARAFICSALLPKAQRVMPTAPRIIRKKSTAGGASVAIKPGGGMGPKEAAALEAAAKLKSKRAQRRPATATAAASRVRLGSITVAREGG